MRADNIQRFRGFRLGKMGPFKGGRTIILIVAVLTCIIVGVFVYQSRSGSTTTAVATSPVEVKKGMVSTSVTAPGTVVANKKVSLAFTVSGKIASIPVSVGDSVKTGQVLGKLDTSALDIALTQAQSKLKTAEIGLQQMQNGGTAEAVVAAQSAYGAAVAQYQETARGASDSELKAAEQTVASAQEAYDKAMATLATVQASPDPDGIQAASLALEQAKDGLWSTQSGRDNTCSTGKEYQCQSANANVASAELAVTQAQTALQTAQASQGKALTNAQKSVESAKASLASAQAALDAVKAGATQSELLSAQSAVSNAKSALVSTKSSTPEDIALAQEKVELAKIAVQQAQADVDAATLVAPFDGIISTIGGNVGESSVSGSAMFSLIDPAAVQVDVNVPEADIVKVAVGESATITFDALSNQTFNGKVIAISPTATVSSGVASYLVSLSIDAKGQAIRSGLSGSAVIVTAQKDNVLIVPSKAIKTSAGVHTVEVITNAGTTETRTVQVGLTGDSGVEITNGLNEGDKVMVKASTSSSNNSSSNSAQQGGMGAVSAIGGGPPPGQ